MTAGTRPMHDRVDLADLADRLAARASGPASIRWTLAIGASWPASHGPPSARYLGVDCGAAADRSANRPSGASRGGECPLNGQMSDGTFPPDPAADVRSGRADAPQSSSNRGRADARPSGLWYASLQASLLFEAGHNVSFITIITLYPNATVPYWVWFREIDRRVLGSRAAA